MDFRVTALPAGELDVIRSRGVDDFGNPLVVTEKQEEGGAPLRCCLLRRCVCRGWARVRARRPLPWMV